MTALAFPAGALAPSDVRKRVRLVVRGDGQRTLLEEATCREIVRRCAMIAELVTVRADLRRLGAHRPARVVLREIVFLCEFIRFLAGELGFDTGARSRLGVHDLERFARAYLDLASPPALAGSVRSLLYPPRRVTAPALALTQRVAS